MRKRIVFILLMSVMVELFSNENIKITDRKGPAIELIYVNGFYLDREREQHCGVIQYTYQFNNLYSIGVGAGLFNDSFLQTTTPVFTITNIIGNKVDSIALSIELSLVDIEDLLTPLMPTFGLYYNNFIMKFIPIYLFNERINMYEQGLFSIGYSIYLGV